VLIIPSSWGSQLVGDLYINTIRINEPFIFPNQAEQVFYVEDESKPGWSVVMKPPKPRGLYDTGNEEYAEDTQPFHVSHLAKMFKSKRHDKHWVRIDIEGTGVDDNTNAPSNEEYCKVMQHIFVFHFLPNSSMPYLS
jgi:hypothetical protein